MNPLPVEMLIDFLVSKLISRRQNRKSEMGIEAKETKEGVNRSADFNCVHSCRWNYFKIIIMHVSRLEWHDRSTDRASE